MADRQGDADREALAAALARTGGGAWTVQRLQASGFCDTWRAQAGGQQLFVKVMPFARADVLEAEADGLAALAASQTIRVPAVVANFFDATLGAAVLAMEWLDLRSPDAAFGARFGVALGALHRAVPPAGGGRFGWRRDNLIGATPQRNTWSAGGSLADWIAFYRSERLEPMRKRLQPHAPALCDAVEAVERRLASFFDDGHVPRASLVHGDLWSGNWGMLADGTPVIYDPAVSCSDAEAELAMMELFGQPPAGFHEAYTRVAGHHAGYAQRRALYQLYHLLNHAVLFGGGYVGQAQRVAVQLASRR